MKRLLALTLSAALAASALGAQAPDPARLKDEARQAIDANAGRLGQLIDAIYSYAELG